MVTESQVKTQLRLVLGGVSAVKLTADEETLAVEKGVRRYSRRRGAEVVGEITTAENVAEYAYDTAVVAKILDVLPFAGIGITETFELEVGRTFVPDAEHGGASRYDNPSLDYIQAYKRAAARRQTGPMWKDNIGTLWLRPAPVSTGDTVYYLYRKAMTLGQAPSPGGAVGDIPDQEIDLVVRACQIEAMEMILSHMMINPEVSASGKTARYNLTEMRRSIQCLKTEFDVRGGLGWGA